MSKKIRVFLLACVLMLMLCMGITAGASEEVSAEVKGHSLTITDTGISVNFYVDIQGISQNNVEVTMNDKQVDIPAETEEVIIDAKVYNCYVFTQSVVAKEMDDKVSLNIVSGDKELVKDSYCVNDYVAEVQKGGYAYNFENLANAMTYYGEFAEVYFGYKGATSVTDKATSSISEVTQDKFADYAMTVKTMPEGLSYYGTQLNLNSEITLRLLFTVAEGKEASSYGNFSANNTSLGQLKQAGTYYCVDIEGIGADALGTGYTIKCGNQEIITNCSVLTYARAVVNAYSGKEDATDRQKNLLNVSKALYLYNQKAVTYVANPATDVKDIFYNGEGFYAEPDCINKVYLTTNNEATTVATDNTEITSLSQLNGSRTKGYSVWMKEAYDVSEESITGPYVIRRYTDNEGNVLNVTGTATVQAKIDGSCGTYVAQHLGNKTSFTIDLSEDSVAAGTSLVQVGTGATFTIGEGGIIQNSHVENGEVYVSGTPVEFNITGKAKSGVITVADEVTGVTINVEGLTVTGEEEQVVLASHAGQSLTGNGDASAITLIDDGDEHFGVVKHENNVRIASVICVCGDDVTGKTSHDNCPWAGENGIAAVYNIPWQAHTATTGYMPGYNSEKYYYLMNDFTISGKSEVQVESYLDLNGCTITACNGWNVYINGANASYSVADSKGNGTIQMPSDFSAFAYGPLIHIRESSASFHLYGGTIDLSNVSNVQYWLIDINQGEFFMHGGMIKPAKSKQSASSTCIGLRSAGKLCVTGGTIYGDVAHYSTGTITVGGNAEVGLQWENFADYGILGYSEATRPIVCDNLKKDAKIVLTSKANFALSEKEDSDSIVSGFELVTDGKDGHYGVVKKSDGTLAFATTICVCGENVSDNHNHTCAWVKSQTNGIADVYSINWQAHTATTGYMPGYNSAGYYYLTNNLTISGKADVSAESYLDLNGKIITCDATVRNIPIANGAKYSIGDSENGQGTIKLPETSAVAETWGVMFNIATGGTVELYSGTIDMTAAQYAGYPLISVSGTFTMHGGIIKPVQTAKQGNCIVLRTAGSVIVNGGIIYGGIRFWSNTTGSLTVKNNAQVGLQLGEIADYGITAYDENSRLISENVNSDAKIVIVSNKIVLSGTGVASAFTVPTGYVVVETDGELSMVKE